MLMQRLRLWRQRIDEVLAAPRRSGLNCSGGPFILQRLPFIHRRHRIRQVWTSGLVDWDPWKVEGSPDFRLAVRGVPQIEMTLQCLSSK